MENLLKHKLEKMLIFDQKILEVAISNDFLEMSLLSNRISLPEMILK